MLLAVCKNRSNIIENDDLDNSCLIINVKNISYKNIYLSGAW